MFEKDGWKRAFGALGAIVSLLGTGCGQQEPPEQATSTARANLAGGTTDYSQVPNVGEINNDCTGTLIAGQWVLTAGHCVNFQNSNVFQSPAVPGVFYVSAPDYSHRITANSQAVFNMAPQWLSSSASVQSFMGNFNATPTHNGTPDIALIMLTQPIPDPSTGTVTSLVSLATAMPNVGDPIVTWGWGSLYHPETNAFSRNFLNWSYTAPASSSCSNDTYNPNCFGGNGIYVGQAFANNSDSGGPSFMGGSETIFGVTSEYTAGGGDAFGDVEYFRPHLCNLMYNLPHRWCQTGAPLGGEPAGCDPTVAGTSTNIETYVINEDPHCGITQWDSQCVSEASAVANDSGACWGKKGATLTGPTDIMLTGGAFSANGSSWAPVALSYFYTDPSIFTGYSYPYDDPDFTTWAAEPGVTALAGDFNGDGYNDIALIQTGSPWGSIPVALLGPSDLVLHVSNQPVGGITGRSGASADPFNCGTHHNFAGWASDCSVENGNVVPVSGDFDGDGKTDIALVGSNYFAPSTCGSEPAESCGAVPVAFSNGDGTFRVTAVPDHDSATYSGGNPGAGAFQNARAWAIPEVGDFDGDGKSDIAWVMGNDGLGHAISNIPIAFSNGDGTFRVVYATAPYNYLSMVVNTAGGVVAGDFNGDGLSDIAFVGNPSWTSIPVAFSNGNNQNFGFTFTNNTVSGFPALAYAGGVKVVVGDFNYDGMSDIALTGVPGWTSIPLAFAQPGGNFSFANSPVDISSYGENFPADAASSFSVTPIAAGY